MKICELLKNLRQIKGYSLRDVEEKIGISYAYLSQIENGKIKAPSAGFLYKLSKAYSVPYDSIMKAAGYIDTTEDVSNKILGLALAKTETLSNEESSKVADFISFLRGNRNEHPKRNNQRTSVPIENIHLELKNYAKQILRETALERITPVPESQILDYLKLKKEGTADLIKVGEGIFKQTGNWILSGLKKVMGILDYRERVIYVSPEIHSKKDRFVTFHEIAHHTIPWHQELFYADDPYTLSFSADKKIEAEANSLASHIMFGGDRFTEEAADYEISIATAKLLADKYEASYHASLRRYVETHESECLLVIFKLEEMGSEFLAEKNSGVEYQYLVRSKSFIENQDYVTPVLIEELHRVIEQNDAGELLNNTRNLSGVVNINSFEQNSLEFVYESWGNHYNLFLLVFPKKQNKLRRRAIFLANNLRESEF